ncbi:anti-sigma factor [Agromyces sp. SYSU T00266]|uniref:anti-sigma factor n=1 Tax=Agromyces zhanjiangensis TaxID=3158562 RepID=UPI0033963250
MDHIEPDELAVLALDGREPDGTVRAHLDACGSCAAEYAALARTVDLGREATAEGLEAPPASVWTRIHGELGLAPELAADPLAEAARAQAEPAAAEPVGEPATAEPVAPAPAAGGHVPPSRPRVPSIAAPMTRTRGRRWWPVAAAAAVVGLLAGVGIGVAIGGRGAGPEATTVLASAELDAFPGWDAIGSATVEQDAAGARTILVDLEADVPEGEVREVWLIRADASGLVSLGLMEGDSARLVVPAGIDLDEYPLVDVSAEPVDGDPAHSGDSIVRGELSAA